MFDLPQTTPLPLRPGETLLWEGTPIPGLHQRRFTLLLMLFGLPFLLIGVGVFFYGLWLSRNAAVVPDAGNALITTAYGLPFAALGGFFVFGPIIDARTASRDITYTLTTRAAYVRRTGRFPSLKVYPILPHTALELERGTRASTVWFHSRLERDSEGDLGTTKAGFENIADADRVFAMILDLQGKAE